MQVHPTTLPGGLEHLAGRRLDALMAVADHEPDATQASAVEAAQELRPERFGLRGTDLQSQHLALTVGIDAHSHYYGHADDAHRLRALDGLVLELDYVFLFRYLFHFSSFKSQCYPSTLGRQKTASSSPLYGDATVIFAAPSNLR